MAILQRQMVRDFPEQAHRIPTGHPNVTKHIPPAGELKDWIQWLKVVASRKPTEVLPYLLKNGSIPDLESAKEMLLNRLGKQGVYNLIYTPLAIELEAYHASLPFVKEALEKPEIHLSAFELDTLKRAVVLSKVIEYLEEDVLELKQPHPLTQQNILKDF